MVDSSLLHVNDVLRSVDEAEQHGRPLSWAYIRELVSGLEQLRVVGMLDLLISAGYIRAIPAAGPDLYVLGDAGRDYLAQWG